MSTLLTLAKNHFLASFRRMRRNWVNSVVNVFCLSVGIACFVLITLYVLNEYNFNRSFDKANRIGRVTMTWQSLESGNIENLAWGLPALLEQLKPQPEVEETVGIIKVPGTTRIKVGVDQFTEENLYQAQSNYFKVFSHSWIAGDPKTALEHPSSIVVTEKFARKYIHAEQPLNQSVIINNKSFIVTGLIRDLPANTDLRFEALLSFDHQNIQSFLDWSFVFILFRKDTDMHTFQSKLNKIFDKEVRPILQQAKTDGEYHLEPLTDIHFGQENTGDPPKGNKAQLVAFQGIGIIVLLISTINYINLTISQSSKRNPEVGIKKVFGASSKSIVLQCAVEAFLFTTISFAIAIVLYMLVKPAATSLIGYELSIKNLNLIHFFAILLIVIPILVIGAGTYQAIIFSNINPVASIRGLTARRSKVAFRLTNVLLVVQLTASITLIVCSLIISKQVKLLTSNVPSFNKDQVIILDVPDDITLRSNLVALQNDLERLSYVTKVSAIGANSLPTSSEMFWDLYDLLLNGETVTKLCSAIKVDQHYLDLLKIHVIEGMPFSDQDVNEDSSFAVIVNKELVTGSGMKNPLDEKIRYGTTEYTIKGVVENFNDNGLHKNIDPVIIFPSRELPSKILVKVSSVNSDILESINSLWKTNIESVPLEYEFLDKQFMAQFKKETTMQALSNYFAVLSIIIAILGLLSITSIDFNNKTKEFTIRKVFGANVFTIAQQASKEYLYVFSISVLISLPLILVFMDRWLQNFAYQTRIQMAVFASVYLLLVMLIFLIILFQVWSTVRKNSISGLKNE